MALTIETSPDDCVSNAGVTFPTGRKWKVQSAVDLATARLKHKDIVGKVCIGRHGLGFGEAEEYRRWDTADCKGKRKMVANEIRKMEEEKRMARAVGMASQGAWMKWESAVAKKISWRTLWKMEPVRLQFAIRSTYDLLPTPTNLVRWGKSDVDKCSLCSGTGHLEHILSSCKTALTQRRFTWRHNMVLRKLAHHIELRKASANRGAKPKHMKFVKEGQAACESKAKQVEYGVGLLNRATDWEMCVDLGSRLVFPREIETRLRPDIIIYSTAKKLLIMVELIVPWETRMYEAYERKKLKYSELCNDCREKGWAVWCYPVEVGCRGFVGTSTIRALREIGLTGKERTKTVNEMSDVAERASSWLWLRRSESRWEPNS